MRGLVYNQVWEDYAVDRQALEVGPADTVLMVTSGGCNVLNTALEGPARIVCVDSNPSQHALLQEKLQVIRTGDFAALWERFGAPAQRRRGSVYFQGAYGNFHLVRPIFGLACGADRLRRFLESASLAEQARLWREELGPRLWRGPLRSIPTPAVAIFGVHWRQWTEVARGGAWTLERICRARLDRVLSEHPIRENPYWHQMLAGAYADSAHAPPYLRPENLDRLRANLGCIGARQADLSAALREVEPGAFSCANLLDVPDFLDGDAQSQLFGALARATRPGARVLLRSFAERPRLSIPRRMFEVDEARSAALSRIERTASYGRVTLLRRTPEPQVAHP